MGYSTSTATLEKMLPYFDELLKERPCAWRVEGMTPFKFAYKVREALYIASQNEEAYPELARVARSFVVQVKGDRVIAVPNETAGVVTVEVDVTGKDEDLSAPTLVVNGAQTAMTIIEKWIDARRETISFPDASLNNEDLLRLYRWAEARDVLMFVSDPSITVQIAKDDLRDLAWTPEDL